MARVAEDMAAIILAAIVGLFIVAIVVFNIYWREILAAVIVAFVLAPVTAIVMFRVLRGIARAFDVAAR